MPISHQSHFIFVHVPKCAGNSIRSALLSPNQEVELDGRASLEQRTKWGERWLQHLPAAKLREILPPSVWQSYFKFAVVRNPWDRMVSMYYFFAGRLDEPKLNFERPELVRHLKKYDSFEKWLPTSIEAVRPCCDYIYDDRGELLVDKVAKFENLITDLKEICDRIGIECVFPHHNRSTHDHYRKYYTRNLAEMVGDRFKCDVDRFNYSY